MRARALSGVSRTIRPAGEIERDRPASEDVERDQSIDCARGFLRCELAGLIDAGAGS